MSTNESQLSVIRHRRDLLLKDSDWTQFADSPLTPEMKQAFADYRQQLRDVPQQYEQTGAIAWPVKPE